MTVVRLVELPSQALVLTQTSLSAEMYHIE